LFTSRAVVRYGKTTISNHFTSIVELLPNAFLFTNYIGRISITKCARLTNNARRTATNFTTTLIIEAAINTINGTARRRSRSRR